MGITGRIKQISSETLDLLKEDPLLVGAFRDAQWLPESDFWQRASYWTGESAERTKQDAKARFGKTPVGINKQWKYTYHWPTLEAQFLTEWETPELDLHKYWQELTFLLAGYVPGYVTSQWTIPELAVEQGYKRDFLSFLVIENSQWDGMPLVNAFGAGKDIGYETGYEVRYLQAGEEVGLILDGLLELSPEGFEHRFMRESQQPEPLPWIDWSEDEMLDWMMDYYNEIVSYYEDAVRGQKALLLYLT